MTATERVRAAYAAIDDVARPEIWIALRPLADALSDAEAVDAAVRDGAELPLAGLVAAVKNNIDVAGVVTTAGRPTYSTSPAVADAPVVARLRAAGAVVIGATNLDQFATGLVGTRSPYGAVRDARRPDHISGGSSSGSAVAVALGLVDVALGTDTAGSGRVPAALQGVVGIKPTPGVVPTDGVVPACRSYDCVTVLARDLDTADAAMGVLAGGARPFPPDAPLAAPPMLTARVTGRVGLCTVHQGPGVTNTLTGLAEAVKNRTPLVLLAGDTPVMAPGGNLDIDQDALARAVGAGVQRIRGPQTTTEDVAGAVRRARVERRPIVLSVPVDLQEQDCNNEDPTPFLGPPIPRCRPSDEAVAGVAAMIQSASRPLILAGRGAVLADAGPVLEALGERIGALMANTAEAHGLFAGNRFGVGISGGFSSDLAVRMIGEADLVLVFGASLTYWTTRHGRLLPPVPLVQCDVEPTAIGVRHRADMALVGDAAETASALLAALGAPDDGGNGFRTDAVAREIAAYRRADEIDDQSGDGMIDPRTLLAALEPMLPRERTIATDSGHFMGFPAMYLSVPDSAGYVLTQGFQAVGIGLASALGAAVARPDRLTVAVLGDGGLRMSLGEIDTAVAYRLPVLIVVINDAAYGAEVHHFIELGFPTDIAELEDRDFAAIARAMGAKGVTVRNVSDLEVVGEWLNSREGPMLLDCKVNPRVRAQWLEEAFRPAAA